jgi:exopolysaccharide biosynthesis polyprenyl glycosylphosphotransferase
MSRKIDTLKYLIFDFFVAAIAWTLFFLFRKIFIEWSPPGTTISHYLSNIDFYLGVVIVSVFWLTLNYVYGYYRYVLRKTVLEDLVQTLKITFIGVIILFITLLLNDLVKNYKTYYINGSVLFGLQFFLTLLPRLVITRLIQRKIHNREICFNTVIIGCGKDAEEIYHELLNKKPTDGNNFVGFIKNPSVKNILLNKYLEDLGCLENLPEIIHKYKIEEIIIALDPDEKNDVTDIISWLGFSEITVKAIPGLHNVLKGRVKITNVAGTPLVEIEHEIMPFWNQALKRFTDFVISASAIILLSPVYLFCILGIKLTSKGPIILKQERIGKNGKPFKIFKFRSMFVDAEKNGPNLTKKDDSRLTKFGKILRRTKLDEIPNFINVFKGDMSLIGPRPERKFYIDQIVKLTPHYLQLQKIKPGITSLGQVKFGYAENVDEMTKRLRYDILYMENISISMDLAIIYYTIVLLFKGRHI